MQPETSAAISTKGYADPCTLVVALMYLDRLRAKDKSLFESTDPLELYLPALVLASKYMHDAGTYDRVANSDWAEAAGIEPERMCTMEWNFVKNIDWDVSVKSKEFDDYLGKVENWVARDFVKKNDFCTYNEMLTLMTGSEAAAPAPVNQLSSDETAVYDRQIRVWGLEAQNKLRNSTVLIYGFTPLASEVAKNIVLAGLKGLTLVDNKVITEDDLGNYFFLDMTEENKGVNRAKACVKKLSALNGNVAIDVVEDSLQNVLQKHGKKWLRKFSLVLLIDQPYNTVRDVDKLCRELHIRYAVGSAFGWLGYAFFDMNNFPFLVKQPVNQDLNTVEDVYKKQPVVYSTFEETFNFDVSEARYARILKKNLPKAYYILKALLNAQKDEKMTGNEEEDIATFDRYYAEQAPYLGYAYGKFELPKDKYDHLFGDQLTSNCAIVGGYLAQESIKALSEDKNPAKNLLIHNGFEGTTTINELSPVV